MSQAADRRVRAAREHRRWLAIAVLLVMAMLAGPTPAMALHQHCGDDLAGTGSLGNGHPDTSAHNAAWNGIGVLQELERTAIALEITQTELGDVVDGLDAAADIIGAIRKILEVAEDAAATAASPVPGLAAAVLGAFNGADAGLLAAENGLGTASIVLLGVKAGVLVAETGVQAALFEIGSHVDDEDACGGTLVGDTLAMTWVSMVQRNLATSGPPLAMLLAPSRPPLASNPPEWPLLPATAATDFSWCPAIPATHLAELPSAAAPQAPGARPATTGGDCASTVHLGFLDAPGLGVADIVTNTIAHLAAHGVDVRNADTIRKEADSALAARQYSRAFYTYRRAYQVAMELTSS